MKIRLAEPVFVSVQGEGKNTGHPVIFIRTSGCNILCKNCDTKYSWGSGVETDLEEELVKYEPIKHLVITGGEPLLHKKFWLEFISRHPEYKIEFETNGTVSPKGFDKKKIQFNVSPKFGRIAGKDAVDEEVLTEFKKYDSYYKFVIGQDSDWDYMQALIKKLFLPSDRIYVMPEGLTNWRTKMNAKKYIPQIIANNYKLSLRAQIWLWGKKKQT